MIKEALNVSDLFPTEQKVKLSENSAAWPETINSILIRKYPEISSYIDKVTFSHLDKIKGSAIGYVTMMNNIFRIPFVIDKFTLNPLDVYIKGNIYGYISNDSIKRLISNSWPFKPMSKDDFTQMKKFAAVKLTDITVDQLEKDDSFIKIAEELVESNPQVIIDLYDSLQTSENIKLAGLDPYGFEKVAALEINNTRTGVIIHHFGKNDEELSLSEVAARFGMDKTAELLENNSIITPLREVMVKVSSELSKNQFSFDSSLPRTVNLADGIGGFVRGNIYEVRDIKNPNSKKGHIFLSTRSKNPVYNIIFNSPAKDRIYNIPERGILGEIVDDLNRPSGTKGQALGILINNIVYGPFEVTSEGHANNEYILSIKDGYEYDSMRIHITNDVKTIIIEDDEIYVPQSISKIIYLGEPYQTESPLNKVAAVSVTISSTPDKKSFIITDNGVSGLPSASLQNIGRTKSIAALMHCGLSKEEAKKAVDTAITSGVYKFSATPTATQSEDTTRKEIDSVNDKKKLEKTACNIKNIVDSTDLINNINNISLIKEANMYGNESVDIALGLKLVTPTSVKKYRILIPRIEDTIDGLCKLLMAKRVGGDIVPLQENKIVSSVSALNDIMFELTGI